GGRARVSLTRLAGPGDVPAPPFLLLQLPLRNLDWNLCLREAAGLPDRDPAEAGELLHVRVDALPERLPGLGQDLPRLGQVGARLAGRVRLRLGRNQERVRAAVLPRVVRELAGGVDVSAGLAERPRRRRLAGLREGLLCAGDVAAPLLRVGNPLGGAVGEGMEQLLLSALEGLQGRAREGLGRLRILAFDG